MLGPVSLLRRNALNGALALPIQPLRTPLVKSGSALSIADIYRCSFGAGSHWGARSLSFSPSFSSSPFTSSRPGLSPNLINHFKHSYHNTPEISISCRSGGANGSGGGGTHGGPGGDTPGHLTLGVSALVFSTVKGDDDPNGKTRSEKMLALSRHQLEQELEEKNRKYGKVYAWLRNYVVEPFLTMMRFISLFIIMMPVLLAGLPVAIGIEPQWYRHAWFDSIVAALQRAGPSFIKLGQWAASRSDIFPTELCQRMSKLHSNAKKHSFSFTKQVVSGAFNKPFEECFAEFDEEPLGIGAMAQVYRAKVPPNVGSSSNSKENLTGKDSEDSKSEGATRRGKEGNNGQYVAVKVLHPHVEELVARDLKIMSAFASFINAIPTMEWLSLPGEVATFGTMMRSQLDLRLEAENLRTFNEQFAKDDDVSFPQPYMEVSTRQLLVEEMVVGVSMEKVLKYARNDVFDKRVAALGLDAFLKMLLLNNFIHSDLHAGNIFLTFDDHSAFHSGVSNVHDSKRTTKLLKQLKKAQNQAEWDEVWQGLGEQQSIAPHLWFIDAGLVTELNPTNRLNFIELFKAIATFDGYKAGELMVAKSRTPETAIDKEVFYLKTERLVNQVKKRTFALGSVGIGDLLNSMLEMVRKHHVRMESDFITVVISILLLEGIGRRLDPDLDIFKSALPVLRKVSQQHAVGSLDDVFTTEDMLQMLKVWVVLETRQFITASVQDIYRCVKYDRLSPNN